MRIYFAASESTDMQEIASRGLFGRAFVSFFILHDKRFDSSPAACIRTVLDNTPDVIIDSGAYSFFSPRRKNRTQRLTPDEYHERYIDFLKSFNGWDYFVELDIGEVVGQKKVLAWRKRLAKEGLLDRCVTVYHPACTTEAEYVREVDGSESRYVGLQGFRRLTPRLPYNRLIKIAYERGVRVHGFAITRQRILQRYPFYSVDSSSWKAAVRYGVRIIENDDGSIGYVRRTRNKRLRYMAAMASMPKGFAEWQDDPRKSNERALLNAKTLQAAEARLTRLWETRGVRWDEQISSKKARA